MAAAMVGAIDQEAMRTGCAHFGEDDFEGSISCQNGTTGVRSYLDPKYLGSVA
jgi:hypothetical protein